MTKSPFFKLILLFSFFIFSFSLKSQNVGINTTTPDASAALDINSTTSGVLVPRMTTAQRTAISTPATGLLVFDTTLGQFYFYSGTTWTAIPLSTTSSLTSNYMPRWNGSTLVNSAIYDNTGTRIAIGTTAISPESRLALGAYSGLEGGQLQLNNGTDGVLSYHLDNFNDAFRVMAGTNDASDRVRMIIKNNGYMGIGTSDPTDRLEVNGRTKTTNLQMTNGATNGYVLQSDAAGYAAWVNPTILSSVSSSTPNYVPKWNGTALEDGILYDNGTQIGIGTTTIANQSRLALGVMDDGEKEGGQLQFNNASTSTVAYHLDTYDDKFRIMSGTNTGATDLRMVVSSTGDVGIGTGTPTAKLDVEGTTKTTNVKITSGATNGYVLQSDASGNGSWVNPTTFGTSNWTTSGTNQYNALSGNVGIGLTVPTEKLHLGEGNFVSEGTYGSSPTLSVSGVGTRLFFYPKKGAFRAGGVTGAHWDDANVGNYSIALGYNSTAKGAKSFATGEDAYAKGSYSIALGQGTYTDLPYSVALGYQAGAYSTKSISIGSDAKSYGLSSVGLGNSAYASGDYSVAIGSGVYTTGSNSTTLGSNINAISHAEVVVGSYNSLYAGTQNSWVTTDRIFTVGNGSSSDSRSNAMVILKNGNTGIATNSPSEKLEVSGKTKTTTFQMTTGATDGYVLQSDASGNGTWVSPTISANSNWTTSGINQYHALSGNVGIGTTTPSVKLDVSGTTSTTNLKITSGATSGYVLQSDASGNGTWVNPTTFSNNNWTTTGINQYNALSGNVGIGTTTPSVKLDVSGTTSTTNLKITNGATSGYVLQSDASGNGTWVNPTTFSNNNWTTSGTNQYNALSGNVGVGTTSPTEKIHLSQANLLVEGTYGTSATLTTSGAGTKMFFYPKKGAFRAGGVSNTSWNDGNIGNYSTAFGYNSFANGTNSFAVGQESIASGTSAIAIGSGTQSLGVSSFALGNSAQAKTDYSVALGSGTVTEGNNSAALGSNITARSYSEVALGAYSTEYSVNSTSAWNTNDRILTIGNGTSSSSRSDAMVILKNGNMGIGTTTPTSKLHISGSSTLDGQVNFNSNWNIQTGSDFWLEKNGTRYLTAYGTGGNMGVGTSTPNSTFEVGGSMGMKPKTGQVAGTNAPDATAMIWQYTSGSGTITLPTASACTNRTYVIVNATGSTRTISSYKDLSNTSQTTISTSTSLWIVSDGTNWVQIK